MIVFSLKCDLNHRFDAWFQSGRSFEEQNQKKLLECPHCGSTGITKAPMSPRIARQTPGNRAYEESLATEITDFPFVSTLFNLSDKTDAIKLQNKSALSKITSLEHVEKFLAIDDPQNPNPQLLREALLSLRDNIRETCDDVGSKFAEEARRIHYGEAKKRNIYGQASYEEMLDLRQEGVDVSALPPFPREDA